MRSARMEYGAAVALTSPEELARAILQAKREIRDSVPRPPGFEDADACPGLRAALLRDDLLEPRCSALLGGAVRLAPIVRSLPFSIPTPEQTESEGSRQALRFARCR